jgi:hypothetical protein
MGRRPAPRFIIAIALLFVAILLLATSHYSVYARSTIQKVAPKLFTNDTPPASKVKDGKDPSKEAGETANNTEKEVRPEQGNGALGMHFRVQPSASNTSAKFDGCEYPILIHVTPDIHCTGALTLYASIVRNVLQQPEALQNKVCLHVTYVDTSLTTIENMYNWEARPNPYTYIKDCAALDTSPQFNDVVPVRFQALPRIEKPEKMQSNDRWVAALNKLHSWGFDLYPRILILDADSIILTDLYKIFLETSTESTISGAPDQFGNCHDRTRLNGGMILLKPSRYFHMSAAELLHDPGASCLNDNWGQSEQEVLNCICGYTYTGYQPKKPEFKCSIMPLYNSLWPRNYGCSVANIVPLRSIHFAGAAKPWEVSEEGLKKRPDTGYWRCVRDGARTGKVNKVLACKAPKLADTRDLGNLKEEKKPEETEDKKTEEKKTGDIKGRRRRASDAREKEDLMT